jgi:exodeoxyribonuclease VII large subunit
MDREPVSVSQLNAYIKELLDNDINLSYIPVRGEISNLKRHSSGHIYFTLKDENAKIRCVMFKSYALLLKFRPEDGMNVVIQGSVSVYERDGQYQFYCVKMDSDGIGNLYIAYEQLKSKLEEEGLFSQLRKKPLPLLPGRIGVATSRTGAVIRDIINVSLNRYKGVDILLYPVSVQGEGAAETICKAIEYFNTRDDIDVIIIGRGGGSIEELWAFNEEKLARAIYASHIPIISAVGHETDFTISDFTADVRASTPSHAAELAVPSIVTLENNLESIREAMGYMIKNKLRVLESSAGRLRSSLEARSPGAMVIQNIQYVDSIQGKLEYLMKNSILNDNKRFEIALNTIDAFNPANVLKRGYGYVKKDGRVAKKAGELCIGDSVQVCLQDGSLLCTINNILEG